MPATANGIPPIGLGTYGLTGPEGLAAMLSAFDLGYRHIDTAQTYGTEENTGLAVAQSGLDRGDIFVTTKITADNLGRIADSIDDSLSLMGLDYADLVLIHWPAPGDAPGVADYIADLARLQDSGKSRLIGVSNFTRRHIDEAVVQIGEDRLATNQVERHVYLQNHVLADHCAALGIDITAYRPLDNGGYHGDPVLSRIAARLGVLPGQVALAYLLGLGSIVIPKSATPSRQASNLGAATVDLTEDDMEAIRALDRGQRAIAPEWGPDWD